MDKLRIVAGKEDEPEWMKGKFRDYWSMWQGGDIKMSDFCDLIDALDEVPKKVKNNWRRDLMASISDINKAIFIYNHLEEEGKQQILEVAGYDPKVRYTIDL